MDEPRLELLRDIEAPEPSEAARNRALSAANEAFEAQQDRHAQKKTRKHGFFTQGFATMARLIGEHQPQTGRFYMNKQLITGTAMALVVALSAGLYVTMGPDIVGTADTPAEKQEADPQQVQQNKQTPPTKKQQPATSQQSGAAQNEVMATSDMAAPAMRAQPQRSRMMPAPGQEGFPPPPQGKNRDQFESVDDNPIRTTKETPVSTFSIDVDTASYSVVRDSLNNGQLPPQDAVRVEELINYFDYDYPLPEDRDPPFASHVSVTPSPWDEENKLVHIGLQGYDIEPAEAPRANLVFLIDVSGSMRSPDKLELLKNAFRMLVDNMHPDDRVAIVTYAGHVGTALEPTKAAEKQTIIAALDNLRSGGSTAGAKGIKQAYALAEQHYMEDGVNRVMLATDGDFNVGITDPDKLKDYIERKRESGVFLSVLGFGRGNYNDLLMQQLAQNGNGNAAYIDTLSEARKVLVEEASSTLFPIAKDVKIQVEFNPANVAEYRLIGYETRQLKREDFNNDKVDAGDIGAGHSVTAIYEITPVGAEGMVDELRYGDETSPAPQADSGKEDEYAFLKMRYKLPEAEESKLITRPITDADAVDGMEEASQAVRFSTAVAGFGQLLRGGTYLDGFGYDDVLALAQTARGDDPFGYRAEFLQLVRLATSARAQ